MIFQSNSPAPLVLEFWLTIAFTTIPGVLGGITNGVSMFLKEIRAKPEEWPPNGNLSAPAFFLAQALSGLGGALAALLVTLWANRFPDPFFETKSWLTLVCTGFVAGYVANRLLPAIADSLYNRLTRLNEKTDKVEAKAEAAKQAVAEANDMAEVAEKNANRAIQLASELVRTSDYLRAKDFSQRRTTLTQIARLSELLLWFPANRTLNILLARLHDEAAGDCLSAIAVLTAFVEAKTKAGEGRDEHTADAYWNLGNYFEEERKKTGDMAFRAKAIQALRESITRVPIYYNDLAKDDDFNELRESPEGKALMAESKRLYEEWLKNNPST